MLVMVGKLDYDCIAWPFRRLAGRPATRMLRNFLAQLHEAEDFCRTSVGLLDDIELLVKSYIRALLRWDRRRNPPCPYHNCVGEKQDCCRKEYCYTVPDAGAGRIVTSRRCIETLTKEHHVLETLPWPYTAILCCGPGLFRPVRHRSMRFDYLLQS